MGVQSFAIEEGERFLQVIMLTFGNTTQDEPAQIEALNFLMGMSGLIECGRN